MTDVYPTYLSRAIGLGATNPPGKSFLHGEAHWKSVAMTGFFLARYDLTHAQSFDPEFLFVFACLHDVMRENEDEDPEHGHRAAALWSRLVMDGVEGFAPYDQRTQDMHYALRAHVGTIDAHHHPNYNVGLCWDADRLNLWRVGVLPDHHYLTTDAAKSHAAFYVGRELAARLHNAQPFPTWPELLAEVQTWRYP